jgi:hypothetical protein
MSVLPKTTLTAAETKSGFFDGETTEIYERVEFPVPAPVQSDLRYLVEA